MQVDRREGRKKSSPGGGYTIQGSGMLPRLATLVLSCIVLFAGCATASSIGLKPVERSIPPTPAGVYDIAQVTIQPRATRQGAPRYPFELRRANVEGEATIYFIVTRSGEVAQALAVKATDERFGEAAREAIAKWRFEPASVNGQPVNCAMMVPIVFSLNQ